MERVSVIIPAYNAANFIEETVDSALAQTHHDLEVIVVNDGSTDDTGDRLRRYGSRIQVLELANGGVSRARNEGVAVATGSWLAFLDADDLWAPTKLEQQLTHRDAPWCFTDRYNMGAYGALPKRYSESIPMRGGDIFEALMLDGNFITLSTVLLRRSVFEESSGFFPELHGTADFDLWLRIAERHPIAFCPEPLVSYRFHPGGMSNNYLKMGRERHQVITRALALDRGRRLDWRTKRRIRATTWETNADDARRAGARGQALTDLARAVAVWPFRIPLRHAIKVCLDV